MESSCSVSRTSLSMSIRYFRLSQAGGRAEHPQYMPVAPPSMRGLMICSPSFVNSRLILSEYMSAPT